MSIAYNNKKYYREKICKPKVNHGANSSDFFLYSRFILNTVAIGANGFARSSSDFFIFIKKLFFNRNQISIII